MVVAKPMTKCGALRRGTLAVPEDKRGNPGMCRFLAERGKPARVLTVAHRDRGDHVRLGALEGQRGSIAQRKVPAGAGPVLPHQGSGVQLDRGRGTGLRIPCGGWLSSSESSNWSAM